MATRSGYLTCAWALGTCIALTTCGGSLDTEVDSDAVLVSVITDQADAVLRILEARAAGELVDEDAWQALLASEGYRRVMEREAALDRQLGIDRGYTDESFRQWLESDTALTDLPGQARVLATWHEVDGAAAGRRALAYLPDSAVLRATIYPIIRKQTNSFVWDLSGDPAIFMHVGPGSNRAEIESILAHELHHVGLSGTCTRTSDPDQETRQLIDQWLTGFGEGLAVLAAAGSPESPTHALADDEGLAAWEAGMARLEPDMRRLESFFLDIAAGAVRGEELQRRGMALINAPDAPQGPFYTVGWHMAATVERLLGRPALMGMICDPATLIRRYNRAAAEAGSGTGPAPLWSEAFIGLLQDGG
jgi:hypothetical protein